MIMLCVRIKYLLTKYLFSLFLVAFVWLKFTFLFYRLLLLWFFFKFTLTILVNRILLFHKLFWKILIDIKLSKRSKTSFRKLSSVWGIEEKFKWSYIFIKMNIIKIECKVFKCITAICFLLNETDIFTLSMDRSIITNWI